MYVDIYSGPEYMIHFRYATILNITFVCLMYGTAMPILYLIALFAFLILYFSERLLVCYYYKQPPAFDEEMTMNTLNMLLWAPLIHMMFTYWYLSNNQIFDNAVFAFKTVKDVALSGHTVIMEFSDLKFD